MGVGGMEPTFGRWEHVNAYRFRLPRTHEIGRGRPHLRRPLMQQGIQRGAWDNRTGGSGKTADLLALAAFFPLSAPE